jgi:hypothetical protein
VALGQEVLVQASATDSTGIVRVELWVDGVLSTMAQPPSPQASYPAVLRWTPATLGAHTLMAKAINTGGVTGDSTVIAISVVSVGEVGKTPSAPTNTPSVPPTNTPPPPPTSPPPPPGCSGTPNIASFTASPDTITAGGSSTLSWGAVTNADSAEIDQSIGGVATPGSTSVSPASTTTYTLTARCGSNTKIAQVTVTVKAAIPSTEYVDANTVEQNMHACPKGYAIRGVRVDQNLLLCRMVVSPGDEQYVATIIDAAAGTVRAGMHACPVGMYMRGLHVAQNLLMCSYDSRQGPNVGQQEFEDSGSVGYNMHICPQSGSQIVFLTGIRVDQNRFLCGIH